MPCSSSRSAIVGMSDHPRPQRLGGLFGAVLFPALVMQPGHCLLDVHGPCAAASDEAPVIVRSRDHQFRVNAAPHGRKEFFARGLLRIVMAATRRVLLPELLELNIGDTANDVRHD